MSDMTTAQARLRRAEIDVESAVDRLRVAKQQLLDGKAKLAQEYTAAIHKLEDAVRAEEISLKRQQTFVEELRETVERGFET